MLFTFIANQNVKVKKIKIAHFSSTYKKLNNKNSLEPSGLNG